jgi:tetratricopeptide (TPR) repeat protein/SAM-dependent methyltransferase
MTALEEVFKKAVEAHVAGDLSEAEKLFREILEEVPEHSDANYFVGLISVAGGHLLEALGAFQAALKVNSSVDAYWVSYLDVLIRLGSADEASAILSELKSNGAQGNHFDRLEERIALIEVDLIKAKAPSSDAIQAIVALCEQGHFEQVIEESLDLLSSCPDSAILNKILGLAYMELAQNSKALDAFERGLKIEPKDADTHFYVAEILRVKGHLDGAVASYKEALTFNPEHVQAFNNMGISLRAQGKTDAAIASYCNALQINPDHEQAAFNLGTALTNIRFVTPDKNLASVIAEILDKPGCLRPSTICEAVLSLVKQDEFVRKALVTSYESESSNALKQVVSDLSKVPLLLKLMKVCPITDLEFEALFTGLRSGLLFNIASFSKDTDILEFQVALATQCHITEYIYAETEIEEKAVGIIEQALESKKANLSLIGINQVACLASYRGLYQYPFAQNLLEAFGENDLLRTQIRELEIEVDIKPKITRFGEVSNEISLQVREQYEQNPYPKWVNLSLPLYSKSISEVASDLGLRFINTVDLQNNNSQILVAGCGTGQQALETSSRFKDCDVLAVDLSLSSLAYAKRKTQEFKIGNIAYMHGDILQLHLIDRQFDLIESTGVLHHMENPEEGWRELAKHLKPGGLMKIALYSEFARRDIAEARDTIINFGLPSDQKGIKNFREQIKECSHPDLFSLTTWSDFYCFSEFRDLVFHAQEHRFTLLQIQDLLKELRLNFAGFELVNNNEFISQNTDSDAVYDLNLWHKFEVENPTYFSRMYQFWCQKDFN